MMEVSMYPSEMLPGANKVAVIAPTAQEVCDAIKTLYQDWRNVSMTHPIQCTDGWVSIGTVDNFTISWTAG